MNDRDLVARARDYPFPFPQEAFVYTDRGLREFEPALTQGRTPVLAIGSNQSPIRLGQKFGHDARHQIPVQRAKLSGFDIVFSAHIATYGSVPAMLQVAPEATVSVAITWLDDEQLEIMNKTEVTSANYHLAELSELALELDDGRHIDAMHAYVSRRGHLDGGAGNAIALQAMTCAGRRLPAMHTGQVLELVREMHAAELDSADFILRMVKDSDYRRSIVTAMQAGAGAFEYPMRIVA